ncbi:MAG: S41 family peptidase [Lysobacter sp.]|nr:MAG: S41 family peptidase [Lysobacter sp.]
MARAPFRPLPRRALARSLRAALLLCCAALAGPVFAQNDEKRPSKNEDDASKLPIEEIRRYVNVYNVVKQAYVEPIEDRKLMQSAIRGLLLDLDPHSAYLPKPDADAFVEDSDGAYDGIGVEVQQQPDGSILVIAPIDDTPAAKAGVKAGDLIIAVDGKALTPEIADGNPLRGAPGTKTVLTVQREGAPKPLQITVQRETIRVGSVRGRMLEPGYGYIRVSAFQADTAKDFNAQLLKLQTEAAGKGLRGLVLDLRSNPGGLLTSAVQIADDLLEKGKIVSTRGRISLGDAEFNATPGDLLRGAPLAVVIDAGSASASEVLAAALRDNQRATLVGSRTFGKGSVQTVLPLDNGDSVKLTTARYYTPSGKSIQARGIDPDVLLKPDATVKGARSDISEAGLPGHLRGDQEAAGVGNGDVLEGDAPIAAALQQLKKTVAALPDAQPERR